MIEPGTYVQDRGDTFSAVYCVVRPIDDRLTLCRRVGAIISGAGIDYRGDKGETHRRTDRLVPYTGSMRGVY